jgi:twinfilin-like protein
VTAKWVLLAWVPDNSRVRDKMLYSSSREDLKKSLGLGYFVGEYYANSYSDLTWVQFIDYISKERTDGPLTLKEQLILEEKALTHSESHSTKSTAMGALPFSLSAAVTSALSSLQSGEINWVEMYLSGETIELSLAKVVDTKEPLQAHVPLEARSFHFLYILTPIDF